MMVVVQIWLLNRYLVNVQQYIFTATIFMFLIKVSQPHGINYH